jgi:hypothetical protein
MWSRGQATIWHGAISGSRADRDVPPSWPRQVSAICPHIILQVSQEPENFS